MTDPLPEPRVTQKPEKVTEEQKETREVTRQAINKSQRLQVLQRRKLEPNQIQPGGFTREQ